MAVDGPVGDSKESGAAEQISAGDDLTKGRIALAIPTLSTLYLCDLCRGTGLASTSFCRGSSKVSIPVLRNRRRGR